MDAKALQIVIAENHVVAPIGRANHYLSSVDVLDGPRAQTAFTSWTYIPFRCRRLLDKHATVKQPIKRPPGMWRRLTAPQNCGFARLTQPQQQPGQRLGHREVRCGARAS